MRHGKALCLALAILFAALCAGCGGGQLMSDLDTLSHIDLGQVLDEAMDVDRSNQPSRAPALPQAAEDDARSAFAADGDAYRGEDGSVLTVRADGTCVYAVPAGPLGGDENGQLIFEGTVTDGAVTFTRLSYFGMDITALAQQAGLDAAHWEADAAALYGR